MSQDYYSILGVPRNATDDQIKKAFRKLALTLHPDKQHNKSPEEQKANEERFKKVTNAYEVLSDKDKKRVYDQYGEAGLQGGVPSGGGHGFPGGGSFFFTSSGGRGGGFSDPRDVFARFFSGMMDDESDDDDFGMFGGRSSRARPAAKAQQQQQQQQQAKKAPAPPKKPEPTTHNLALTLEEMYTGCMKKLKITRTRGGKQESKIIEIEIKPGWKAGTKLTYENEGDQAANGLYSDIVFVISEKPHQVYKRVNNDVVIKVSITLTEALTGFKRIFTNLDGQPLEVDTNGTVISPDNNKKYVWGKGFPNTKNGPGNFVVEFDIVWPRSLTPQQKEVIKCSRI